MWGKRVMECAEEEISKLSLRYHGTIGKVNNEL
jgi:hypothetical protein